MNLFSFIISLSLIWITFGSAIGCGGSNSANSTDSSSETSGDSAIIENTPNTSVLNLGGFSEVKTSANYTVYMSQSLSAVHGQASGTTLTVTESAVAAGVTAINN